MTVDTYADLFDDDLDVVADRLEEHRAQVVWKLWGNAPVTSLPTPELPRNSEGVEG
ncbi:hypothetical protein ACWEOH_19315 [Agromyces sp. NPDC004153]